MNNFWYLLRMNHERTRKTHSEKITYKDSEGSEYEIVILIV